MNWDQLYQDRYSLSIYAEEYYEDECNDRPLCEDIHNTVETAVMGIDEISPEIEPINVQGGAYVN